jgi:hypothetical protein
MEVVRKIPDQLSGLGSATSGQYIPSDNIYDYAIAGIPFLSAITDNRPHTNRMAPIRKEQFDNFAEPGEQSLQGWWLRSQSTFNGGAGVLYQDPDNDNQFNYRFANSLGIDCWTSGQLSLLRNSVAFGSTALPNNVVRGYVTVSGINAYWQMDQHNLDKKTATVTSAIIAGAAEDLLDMTSTGATYIVAKSTGIVKGVDGGAPTTIYNDATTNAIIEFVKDRLIYCKNNQVYQLLLSPAGPPAALPTAIYTMQDPSWTWQSITDGPSAIYVAGSSGTTSQIHKFNPTIDSGGLPILQWQGVTATMPAGEIINTIYSYVGSFVGIATNKGFRVGEIDQNGDIAYGPLSIEVTGGCKTIVGNDRFMWTGSTNQHDGSSGLYRVDLGNQIQEQTTKSVRYAYARDIYAQSQVARVVSLTMFGNSNRKVFALNQVGSYREQASELLPQGFLDTGRIRFNTEEPKLYKFFNMRVPTPLGGNVSASILTEGGGVIPTVTYSPTLGGGTKDIGISQPTGPQNWLALRFTLFRGATDTSIGGVLNGWQVKALPGSIRQRIITHPFLLFDEETDRGGQVIGYDGYTQERLSAFEAVARAGDVVLFQELAAQLVTQVVIDDFEFQQTGPPGPDGPSGGYLTVVMRTVAEST